jgi:hypothetical protein
MGYLDGTSVTVDAVLTKKGREILSDPSKGTLNITSFTCTDTGVDYTLWNPDHPSGSAYYGEAIENLPMLESSVHAEYALRNRLITLNQNTVAMPAIEFSSLTSYTPPNLTFEDGDSTGKTVTATLKGFTPSSGDGLYFVILDPTVVGTSAAMRKGLSGTTRMFLREQDIPNAVEYHIPGNSKDYNIQLVPDTELIKAGRKTNIYVLNIETGAYNSFTVTNNIQRLTRKVLTNATIGKSA